MILFWSCQDKSKLKTSERFEYEREVTRLKSIRKDSVNNDILYNFKFGMTENEIKTLKDSLEETGLFKRGSEDIKLFYDKNFNLQNNVNSNRYVKGWTKATFENEKLSKLFFDMREPDLKKILKIYYNLYSIPDVYYQGNSYTNYYCWIIGNQEIEISHFGALVHITHFDYTSVSPEELKRREEELNKREYVGNDDYDGSVKQVVAYLKENLKDPRSYESISWSKVMHKDNYYLVRHKYRAKNSLGGYVIENKLFYIDLYGEIYKIEEFNE